MVIMVVHSSGGKEGVRFFDADFQPVDSVTFDFEWHEGPGIAKRPDGQLDPTSACDRVSIDVMRAVGAADVNSWDLAHSGIDVLTGTTCECIAWPRVLEGTLLVSPQKPLTLVRGGERLQFASAAPASRLARTSLDVPDVDLLRGAVWRIHADRRHGGGRHGSPRRPSSSMAIGYGPRAALELITDNGSSIATIPLSEYDGYPVAASLYCLK